MGEGCVFTLTALRVWHCWSECLCCGCGWRVWDSCRCSCEVPEVGGCCPAKTFPSFPGGAGVGEWHVTTRLLTYSLRKKDKYLKGISNSIDF